MSRNSEKCPKVLPTHVFYLLLKLLFWQAAIFITMLLLQLSSGTHCLDPENAIQTPNMSVAGAEQNTSGRQTRCVCHWNIVEGHTCHIIASAETVKTDPTCLSPDIHVPCRNGVWCTDVTCTPFVIDMPPLIMERSCRKELQFFHQCPNKRPEVGGAGK